MDQAPAFFVYGTLRADQPEHRRFCPPGMKSVSARIPGELYQLPQGYPILALRPERLLARAAGRDGKEWEAARKSAPPAGGLELEPGERWIEGELLVGPWEAESIARMDAWEGFRPGRSALYQRGVAWTLDGAGAARLAWVYASLRRPPGARRLDAARWERPSFLGG